MTTGGSVTYQVIVLDGANELPQPLTNTATIDSNETEPSTDTAQVAVPGEVQQATPTPRITPPPTSTLDEQAPGSTGINLMLTLLGLAAFVLVIGFITPVPERVRRRDRR